MTTLTNIFSREKTLFYFTMWNDSDRLGYENFLGYKVKNNLFVIPHSGEKGSVWYSKEELEKIDSLVESKMSDPVFQKGIIELLDQKWLKLLSYLTHSKKISSPEELFSYYKDLVEWWSAMNTVFGIPDKEKAPADFKQQILARRTESEKYTEEANKIFMEYWKESLPQYTNLMAFVLPEEAAGIIKDGLPKEQESDFLNRTQGCFMLNRQIYQLKELDTVLNANDLEIEKVEADKVAEIKGRVAQPGKVIGTVKIIKVKTDTSKISAGDILVTEMTNPDYVPYMKIAGAIITDEGGATCHAAIASRELKVPCIVGTRIATKVLKDGDRVEVDANTGVIKIL